MIGLLWEVDVSRNTHELAGYGMGVGLSTGRGNSHCRRFLVQDPVLGAMLVQGLKVGLVLL